jgi:hypothetical protein
MAKQPSKKAPAKRGRGRPAGRTHDQQMQMRVSAEFLQTIDDWRSKQPDNPPRAEAIRRMVNLAAEAVPSFLSAVEPARPKPRRGKKL